MLTHKIHEAADVAVQLLQDIRCREAVWRQQPGRHGPVRHFHAPQRLKYAYLKASRVQTTL